MPRAPDLSGIALDGRYELHALIGEGAFGRVYVGLDRRLARRVAVKVIKPWWAEDPDWVRCFEREAQLLASVNAPGIVQIFDVGSAAEGLYYVTEMVEGQSLVERLRSGPLDPSQAREMAEQLARALASAHARRVVHRDVKPANVLIAADGRIKVTDFGVARLAEGSSDGVGGTIVGTPRYMAPEQARGQATTPATDVYGLGVVLYEMLAGHSPFEGGSPVELAFRHVHDPPPPLPDTVPSALAAVVERALEKNPLERFGDGAEMAAALRAADVEEPPPRRAAGPTAVLPRPKPTQVALTRPAAEPALKPATRVGAAYSPPRRFNPSERRRRIAILGGALLLVAGMIAGAIALAPGRVKVPRLHGLTRAGASVRLHRAGLHGRFTRHYSDSAAGTVIGQAPRAGVRADDGSTVAVTLSRGPAPVPVPKVVNASASAAKAALGKIKLRTRITQVPAPGVSTGTVVRQSPTAGTRVKPGSTVILSVAEPPRWRGLTSFNGPRSVPFRIRGQRWQLVYSMSYQGTCNFIFICNGPTATVTNLSSGARVGQFDLGDGSGQVKSFTSGPGVYQVSVSPGSDSARWSVRAEDYY
jgi:eukaryotic-like serine/threonine-protein kinase